MMNALSTAVISFLLIFISRSISASPVVTIQNGTLEGSYMKTRKGREFSAFRGIPYAQPPIGRLRFEPSQPASPWSGIRSAEHDAGVCVQSNVFANEDQFHGTEDCLYLNVYTPKGSDSNVKRGGTNYPVMVWIHGGGWMCGSSHSELYNPKFLLDKDVILVSFNYRLGPLGFLSTGDEVLPGNQGLKDQVRALEWVRENIVAFGGDPNSVTIFGESAGGASTHHLMLSPLAKGLFHRVISQSGTAIASWALTTPTIAKKQAQRLAKQLNCPTESSEELRDCLKSKDPIEVVAADRQWQIFNNDPVIPFKPVVEPNHPGAFLTEYPAEILKNGNLTDIPWMTGITSHEGALRTANFYGIEEKNYVQQLNNNFLELAPITLIYEDTCPKNQHVEIAKKIREFYLGDKAIDESTRFNVLDMYTDSMFAFSAAKAVEKHLQSLGSPVYYYYFAYRGSNSWSKVWGDAKRDHGVSHCDELLYLFPTGEFISPGAVLSEQDEKMVDIMTTLWYNFAKTGNPTPEVTAELPMKWKPVRTHASEYLSIENPQNIKMSDNLLKEKIQFWEKLSCVGLAPVIGSKHVKDEL